MHARVAAAILGSSLLVSSCSAGGTSGAADVAHSTTSRVTTPASTTTRPTRTVTYDRNEYVDALATGLEDAFGSQTGARCTAARMIDDLVPLQLDAHHISPDDVLHTDLIERLGLSAEAEQQLITSWAEALRTCGALEGLMQSTLEVDHPDNAVSQQAVACASNAIARPFAEILIRIMKDPSIDAHQAGEDTMPEVLAACPGLLVEIIDDLARADGEPLTPEERSCLTRELGRLAASEGRLDKDAVTEAGQPCLAG